MKELILTHGEAYLIVHFVFAIIGLLIELLNDRYLRVSSFVWAILFGPLYFAHSVWDMDTMVIDLRNKK
jgi:hypothetical protein